MDASRPEVAVVPRQARRRAVADTLVVGRTRQAAQAPRHSQPRPPRRPVGTVSIRQTHVEGAVGRDWLSCTPRLGRARDGDKNEKTKNKKAKRLPPTSPTPIGPNRLVRQTH